MVGSVTRCLINSKFHDISGLDGGVCSTECHSSFNCVCVLYCVFLIFLYPYNWSCGSVAEWLGCWTCDQPVAGSIPSLSTVGCNPGRVVNSHVPLSSSSIIWYQPMGGDALRLGR